MRQQMISYPSSAVARKRTEGWRPIARGAAAGAAFFAAFIAAQWPFADFLLSPASRNWIFGTAYFAYRDPAGLLYDPYKFVAAQKPATFLLTITAALVACIVTTGLGLAWGNWMRRVRR